MLDSTSAIVLVVVALDFSGVIQFHFIRVCDCFCYTKE